MTAEPIDFAERVEAERPKRAREEALRGAAAWLAGCIKGTGRKPLPVLANALKAFRQDGALKHCFAFDEMLRAPILTAALPGQVEFDGARPATDVDVGLAQEYLQQA